MYVAFEVLTVFLAACAMAPALAHALELPGKLRLDEAQYRTVQAIYYPGFTLIGAAEPAAILASFILLLLMPIGSAPFWLTLAALLALALMQAIFWVMTQPVNREWLRETKLTGSAKRFFGTEGDTATKDTAPKHTAPKHTAPDWTVLRDRWERSHVMRAVAASLAVILLTTAVALQLGGT